MTETERSSPDIARLANKIEEIAKRSWNGSDARAIKDAATALRASLQPATDEAATTPDPSREELIESIQYAIGALSMHIDAYHDGDYEPHQVPDELEELRRLQHHLEGSLINSKGEFCSPDVAQPSPVQQALDFIRDGVSEKVRASASRSDALHAIQNCLAMTSSQRKAGK